MINVAFCFNRAYTSYTAVAIYSLLLHSKTPVHLFLICHEVSEVDLKPIQLIAKQFNASIDVHVVKNYDAYGWKKLAYWNEANYLRLLIPDLIHEDKVLYLDSDVIVTEDLTPLYNMPFNDAWILASAEAPKLAAKNQIPTLKDEPYINTGVMLMDLATLRSKKFFDGCLNIHRAYEKMIVGMDQCLINKFAEGRKKILPQRWNQLIHAHFVNRKTFERIQKNTAIIHFSGPIKPWMEWCNAYLIDFWLGYANKTPLNNMPLKKITTYAEAMFKLFKLEEDQAFEEAGLLKNRIINSLPRAELTQLKSISSETHLIRNGILEKNPDDKRDRLSDIMDLLFKS